jgi:threonine dehydrogenase-like Zn-dependent dehydrogenase
MGDGPLGVLNAQVSKSAGASSVILSGHHDSRIEVAKMLGIDHAFNSTRIDALERVADLTGGRGVDTVIVAVASTKAVDEALKIVRKGGKVCVFGDFRDVPQPNLDLDLKLVLRDHIDVVGSWGCSTKNYRLAFELVRSGQVRVREMITHRFPLERFKEALQAFTGKECLKVILSP